MLRDLKKQEIKPSKRAIKECRELGARRKAGKLEDLHDELDARAQRLVDALPELSPEQCRKVAAILQSTGVPPHAAPVRISA